MIFIHLENLGFDSLKNSLVLNDTLVSGIRQVEVFRPSVLIKI